MCPVVSNNLAGRVVFVVISWNCALRSTHKTHSCSDIRREQMSIISKIFQFPSSRSPLMLFKEDLNTALQRFPPANATCVKLHERRTAWMMCAFNHLSNAGSSLIFLIFISKVRSSHVIDSDVMAVRSSMCVTSRLNKSVLQPGIYSVCFVFFGKALAYFTSRTAESHIANDAATLMWLAWQIVSQKVQRSYLEYQYCVIRLCFAAQTRNDCTWQHASDWPHNHQQI